MNSLNVGGNRNQKQFSGSKQVNMSQRTLESFQASKKQAPQLIQIEEFKQQNEDLEMTEEESDTFQERNARLEGVSFFSQQFASKMLSNRWNGEAAKKCTVNEQMVYLQGLIHNERFSPELLPYQFKLISRICKTIMRQEKVLSGTVKDDDDRMFINIHKMELERAKYMLKSYLRTRIQKMEKFLIFLIENDQSQLLSESEMHFAWQLYESKKKLFNNSIFDKIPIKLNMFEQQQELDKQMITKPNENQFVFVRFLKSYPRYTLLPNIEVQIIEDHIYFMPYHCIKIFIEKGEAELL